MSGRMPILCQDDIAEIFGKQVDDRHYLVALRHGKGAVRTEVVLHVDHNEGVAVAGCVNWGQCRMPWPMSILVVISLIWITRSGR